MVFKVKSYFYLFALSWSISSLFKRMAKYKTKQEKADIEGPPRDYAVSFLFLSLFFSFSVLKKSGNMLPKVKVNKNADISGELEAKKSKETFG